MGEIDLKDGFFSSKDDCVCAAKQDQIVVAQTMGCSANAYVVCQNRITGKRHMISTLKFTKLERDVSNYHQKNFQKYKALLIFLLLLFGL